MNLILLLLGLVGAGAMGGRSGDVATDDKDIGASGGAGDGTSGSGNTPDMSGAGSEEEEEQDARAGTGGSARDTGSQSGTNTGTGSGSETGSGSGAQSGTNTGTGSGSNTGSGSGSGSGRDTGTQSGSNTGTGSGSNTDTGGSGRDTGTQSGTNTGTGSGSNTGSGSGSGSGRDTGTQSGTNTGTGSGSNTDTGDSGPDTGSDGGATAGGGTTTTPVDEGSKSTGGGSTDPVVVNPAPVPPQQTGANDGNGGSLEALDATNSMTVVGGRVTTLAPQGEDIASVRILSDVEHGKITVNPDNTMALVMTLSDFTGTQSFKYEVTHANGTTKTHTVELDVTEGPQEAGWATGEAHYMLATDANDRVIVEAGEVHRKVYVSGSEDALTLADIAKASGIDVSDTKNLGKWLVANEEFGATKEMALDEDAATVLWGRLNPPNSESSNWFLLERGYEYDNVGSVMSDDMHGEDPLHPLYLGAWGNGDKPVISSHFRVYDGHNSNIVIQDIAFTAGVRALTGGENIIFDNVYVTKGEVALQGAEGITFRNSEIFDVSYDAPKYKEDWSGERIQGLFSNHTEGLLIENMTLDLNGWREGYDPQWDGDSPMPPNMFNHNVYLGAENLDVTVRDVISMRGSSVGIMVRSGGFIEDNAAIDNNAGMNSLGGDYRDFGPIGNYTLFSDNLVTSAGYHDGKGGGTLSLGLVDNGKMSSLVDNIVAHLADPNNPDEYWEKYWTYDGNRSHSSVYNDTIVYNWWGSRAEQYPQKNKDVNYEHLDEDVLKQTTIQLFAEQFLGQKGATIGDLGEYMRAAANGNAPDVLDADTIIRFFQEGFGVAPDMRTEADTLRFVPSELGEGVRWDNRLNWSTDDLPGTIDGDSVDLGGNDVLFGGNARIAGMEMGDDGSLKVTNGRLTVEDGVTTSGKGGAIEVANSGQIWVGGHTGKTLDLDVNGGRFVNDGYMTDTETEIRGGEVILGSDGDHYEVTGGSRLGIFNAAAKVGFDGDKGGMAILDFDKGSTAKFMAKSGDLGTIEEFRSGAMGDSPDVLSGIDLEGALLEIDLNGLSSEAGNSFTLMSADEIAGVLDDVKVVGLGSNKNATITVDYTNDTVSLQLAKGSGKVSVDTVGKEVADKSAHAALWDALTKDHGLSDDQMPVLEDPEMVEVV